MLRDAAYSFGVLRRPFAYWGFLAWLFGVAVYNFGIVLSIVRLATGLETPLRAWVASMLWYSGVPTTAGLLLLVLDILIMLPYKRRMERRADAAPLAETSVTVALTAYNDEGSIANAVKDFQGQGMVRRVIVVSNNSRDATEERARQAVAIVVNEPQQGYGHCVHRCLTEALRHSDTSYSRPLRGRRNISGR